MSIAETYKGEFQFFYYDEDPVRGENIRGEFKANGYQVEFFSSRGLMFEAMAKSLPQMVLLHYQPMSLHFHETLKKINQFSDEIEVVGLFQSEFWPGVSKLLEQKLLKDAWSWPVLDHLGLRLRVDRLIEKSVYRYIAEQRSPATAIISEKLDQLLKQDQSAQAKLKEKGFDIYDLIQGQKKNEAETITQVIDGLKRANPQSDYLFLRNYKARNQLIIYKTSFADARFFRGQSIQFGLTPGQAVEQAIPDLKNSLKKQLRCGDCSLYPVKLADNLFGFLMVINEVDGEESQRASRQLGLYLRNTQLEGEESEPDRDVDLDQIVPARQFHWVLSREISRGRRLKSPVSLLICQVEYVYDSEAQVGRVFEWIRQALRPYDLIARLKNGQIAIILPHCGYENGAIKAETIRRQIVSMGIQSQSTPLRLCFGVSEFPRLSADSDALILDGQKACAQVYASGKNKVCLYSQDAEFQPEFVPAQ